MRERHGIETVLATGEKYCATGNIVPRNFVILGSQPPFIVKNSLQKIKGSIYHGGKKRFSDSRLLFYRAT
jgi:hypothetical protein